MFLVGGTCIGGGLLAFPVVTGISGFIPSMLMMFLCWLFMTISALLLLEASLWMKEGAHVITMASELLGKYGKIVSWIFYLFISYCSLVAYTAGGGHQIAEASQPLLGFSISKELSCLIFVVVFGIITDLGTKIIGRVNAVLFIAMIAAYIALVTMGIEEVKSHFLFRSYNWSYSLMSIPLLLTSFSFQTMVPSLTPYLKGHAKMLRWAIIGGTTIAFIIYLIWQWLVLGIVPIEGPHGLANALIKGEPATTFLRKITESPYLAMVAEYFAFFALVTSFLGIALGLFDFLSDGLKIQKKGWGKIALGLLVMVPSYFFAAYFERIFIVALESSGGFGDSVLNGIIPVLMVISGRYYQKRKGDYQVGGGKVLLGAVLIFFIFTLVLEVLLITGVIFSIRDISSFFELSMAG